jgi:hypothetical protein
MANIKGLRANLGHLADAPDHKAVTSTTATGAAIHLPISSYSFQSYHHVRGTSWKVYVSIVQQKHNYLKSTSMKVTNLTQKEKKFFL